MHCAVYVREDLPESEVREILIGTWLRLAWRYGAGPRGQHMAPIDGPLGWLEYLSKHAARGVKHYQRNGKPPGWDKTGRLWGHTGTWPVVEPAEVQVTREEFYRFRRLVRSWRVADARRELLEAPAGLIGTQERQKARRRLVFARGMLRSPDVDLSRVRGVSEWIPEDLGMALLLIASGDEEGARAASRRRARTPSRPPKPQRMVSEDF